MSWRAVDPTPFRGWIRWAPRSWPAGGRVRLDLAALRLVWPGEGGAAEPRPVPAGSPEVVYLPPVDPEAEALRDGFVAELVEEGHVVGAQLHPGQAQLGAPAAVHFVDPTSLLLQGVRRLPRPPLAPEADERTERVALLPLLPGLFDGAEELDAAVRGLAELEPAALLGVTPSLTPQDRRRLVQIFGDERFEAVFHGRPPDEHEVARAAARRGLRCLPERPAVPALPARAARNRQIATALVEAGELWLRLGRSEGEGVALLAAARRVEELAPDVGSLALEGNLAILDFLSALGRRVIAEAATGEPGPAAELRAEWCGTAGR